MRGWLMLAALGGVAWALQDAMGTPIPAVPDPDDKGDGMEWPKHKLERIIRDRARAHDVPEPVALAFAQVESNLNANAEGDLYWGTSDGGTRYRTHVLNNPKYVNNPDRDDPSAWHSYGMFQLHSAFHTPPGSRPRDLLDPSLNAELAAALIARLLKRYGSAEIARIAYVCGTPEGCSAERRAQIATNFRRALAHWESAPVA